MILFWVIIGVTMVVSGIYLVHLQDKSTKLLNRLGAIGITMIGSYLLWFIAAVYIPPTHEIRVKVEAELKDGFILSFTANNSRSCKIEKLDVILISKEGNKIHAPSRFMYSHKTGTDVSGFIFVENISNYDVDKVTLSVTHFCPFGFEVETNLNTMNLRSIAIESSPKL